MFSPIKPVSGEEPPAMSMTRLPNALVTEILTRLPGKEVGRCKCVCKPWQKIIRSRPFMETYRKRQRGLLFYWWENISRKDDESGLDMRRFHFFHCPLRRPEELPEEFSPLPELRLVMWKINGGRGLSAVSQLVHGLLCVGEGEPLIAENFRLTIHNICTGEKMRIPNPLVLVHTYSTYHLGYDQASRVYKLLRLIYSYGDHEFLLQGAQIMTLRPPSGPLSTWRELDHDSAGICDFHLVSLHMMKEKLSSHDDGMLCWIKTSELEEKVCDRLLCFDLNMERFRLINLPGKGLRLSAVARFEDRLSLWIVSHGGDNYKVDGISCYVQEDDEGKHWSKHDAEIMNLLMESGGFAVPSGYKISFSPTGQMIVNDADEYSICFSSGGEILVKNPDESWRVYSCSPDDADKEDVLLVGKFPDGDAPKLDLYDLDYSWWNTRRYRMSTGRLTRLMEGNNLYLPLDDVLGGAAIM